MRHTLSSDALVLNVNSKGAELCSIKNKQGYEYLWQGDKQVWPRQAPVLFPIVGKLKDNSYTYDNKTYRLPQHGFARDTAFDLIKEGPHELIFMLKSNESIKALYPFDFELKIGYRLQNNLLLCSYEAKNTNHVPMYFSLGAHPGFNIYPRKINGEQFPYLEIKRQELLLSTLNSGLLSGEHYRLTLSQNRLYISPELFQNDALVMEGGQIEGLSLYLDAEGRKISLSCSGWPHFGIWSKPDPRDGACNFLCLEPWHGIADSLNHNGVLSNKKGILKLDAGKSFEAAFELCFF